MMKLLSKNKASLSLAVVLMTGPVAATTQDASAIEDDGVIEEIIVYAQKRAQNIRDVSLAVSVVSGDLIDKRNLRDTAQLTGIGPNIKVSTNAGEGTTPAFSIRGVGALDYNTSSTAPVAVYVDGVTNGTANQLTVNLFDVEQVEILRGPQGTLFGRNTTGGAILLRSRQPTNRLEGYLTTSFAEQDHLSVEGALNVPLSDTTATRFAFSVQDYDYSTNNLFPGGEQPGNRQIMGRFQLRSEFEDLTVTLKVEGYDWDGLSNPPQALGLTDPLTGQPCEPARVRAGVCADIVGYVSNPQDFFDVNSDFTRENNNESESYLGALTLEYDITEAWSVKSITAYRDTDRFVGTDADGSPLNLAHTGLGVENELFTQEINLTYETDDLYLVFGGFYLDESVEQDNFIDLFRDLRSVPAFFATGFTVETFLRNSFDTEAIAGFAQADYALSDRLTLTAGVRYTDETVDYRLSTSAEVPLTLGDPGGLLVPIFDFGGETGDDEFSAKLGLTYALTEDVSAYASFTRGFKSGGFSGAFATIEAQARLGDFDAETINAYELGLKGSLLDGRLNFAAATFYYDYKDQQAFVNLPGANPGDPSLQLLQNVGDTEIYGVEAEFSFLLDENWRVTGNAGYLPDADIGEFISGPLSVSGSRLPFAPKFTAAGDLFYSRDVAGRPMIANFGFVYQSAIYFDQFESPLTRQAGYALFHARLGYDLTDNIELALWGRNLFNEEYAELLFLSSITGIVEEFKGEARQLGGEITLRF